MEHIKSLFHKRMWTEKTGIKMAKATSIIFYIASLFFFVAGFISMKYRDAIPLDELKTHITILLLCVAVLVLIGLVFDFGSKIIRIEGEIKDLKDGLKEKPI